MLWCKGAKLGLLYYGKNIHLTMFENRAWTKIRGPKLEEVTGWKNCIMNVVICAPIKFYVGDQLKDDEMGRACGTCGRGRNTGFW